MIDFLKSPSLHLPPENVFTTRKGLYHGLLLLLLLLLLLPLVSLLLLLIDHVLLQPVFHYSMYNELIENSNALKKKYASSWLFLLLIVGPLVEEIIFRMPLTLRRTGMALSLSLLTYRISAERLLRFNPHSFDSYLRLLPALIVFIIVLQWWPERGIKHLRLNYYPLYFYTLTTLFAVIHVANFYPYQENIALVPFYILFTLPQWVMGLLLGYARVKHGFLFALLLHAINNFLGSLSVA